MQWIEAAASSNYRHRTFTVNLLEGSLPSVDEAPAGAWDVDAKSSHLNLRSKNEMKINRKLVGLSVALIVSGANAAEVLSEGFGDISTLSAGGWLQINNSLPVGATGWFQGNAGVFGAQAGATDSYVGANYLNAATGGTIDNWLLTPAFSTESAGVVRFWARAEVVDSFFDVLDFGLVDSSGNVANVQLPDSQTLGGDWTEYTVSFGAMGAGTQARFAFRYNGLADASNYIGIDTVSINLRGGGTVPEPASFGLLGLALAGLVGSRRAVRQQAWR